MPAAAVVLLVLQSYYSVSTSRDRDRKAEENYRAAQIAETDADRRFRLAIFGVFKAQAASHSLGAELWLGAGILVALLFAHEIFAEVHSLVANLP